MSEWIYFIHPPREDFAATMTDDEKDVWSVHFELFKRLLADGVIILVGPTLGPNNTGIAIFEAPDEAAARRPMEEDPVVAGGFARGNCGRSACRSCAAATRKGSSEITLSDRTILSPLTLRQARAGPHPTEQLGTSGTVGEPRRPS